MTMRKVGVGLVVAAYLLLVLISLGRRTTRTRIRNSTRCWPGSSPRLGRRHLACALALAGIVLALVPLRRGERWALWTQLAMLVILFSARMASDPRCLVVLDPHQHGCHSFVIAIVLGVIGLVLARK